jgi:phosphoserine phosphatase
MGNHIQALLNHLGYEKEIAQFLANLIQTQQNIDQPPLIVFDCDQTLIQGDVGEILLSYLWKNQCVQSLSPWEEQLFTQAFADHIAPSLIQTVNHALLDSHRYFGYLWDLYKLMYEVKVDCALSFAAGCLLHFEKEQQSVICQKAFESAVTWDLTHQELKGEYLGISNPQTLLDLCKNDLLDRYTEIFQVPKKIWIHVQPFIAQIELVRLFRKYHFEVAVISGSAQTMVEQITQYFDIPKDHIVAIRFENGVLFEPAPIHHKKIDACLHGFGRMPLLMFGDSMNDISLMAQSKYSVLIDYQKENITKKAVDIGALLQNYQKIGELN